MSSSGVVNVSDWEFSFGGSDPRLAGTPSFREPTIVRLATVLDLLLRLAEDGKDDNPHQHQIQQRLKTDPVAKAWHEQTGKDRGDAALRTLPKGRQVRGLPRGGSCRCCRHCLRRATGTRSRSRSRNAASAVIIPNGQVLFHGRGDRVLHSSSSYASFISTSLDPTVCIRHAVKRQVQKGPEARAGIYLLTTRAPLHVIWGNGGALKEWELLVPTRLQCTELSVHECTRFDIAEIDVRSGVRARPYGGVPTLYDPLCWHGNHWGRDGRIRRLVSTERNAVHR